MLPGVSLPPTNSVGTRIDSASRRVNGPRCSLTWPSKVRALSRQVWRAVAGSFGHAGAVADLPKHHERRVNITGRDAFGDRGIG